MTAVRTGVLNVPNNGARCFKTRVQSSVAFCSRALSSFNVPNNGLWTLWLPFSLRQPAVFFLLLLLKIDLNANSYQGPKNSHLRFYIDHLYDQQGIQGEQYLLPDSLAKALTLIKSGADVNMQGFQGMTMLHV